MSNTKFVDATSNIRESGIGIKECEEVHVLRISDKFFVCVRSIHTESGPHEWQTAINSLHDVSDRKRFPHVGLDYVEVRIVDGDYREVLEGKTERQIMDWYNYQTNQKN